MSIFVRSPQRALICVLFWLWPCRKKLAIKTEENSGHRCKCSVARTCCSCSYCCCFIIIFCVFLCQLYFLFFFSLLSCCHICLTFAVLCQPARLELKARNFYLFVCCLWNRCCNYNLLIVPYRHARMPRSTLAIKWAMAKGNYRERETEGAEGDI